MEDYYYAGYRFVSDKENASIYAYNEHNVLVKTFIWYKEQDFKKRCHQARLDLPK